MKTLASYISGSWVEGKGSTTTLLNPATEEPLAQVSTEGLDLGAALDFGRRVGGPAVRALSFAERGAALKKMSELLVEHREELIGLAIANGGNTRGDSKFDIDGAAATLAAYADLGASLGDAKLLIDGEGIQLGRSPRFHGQHVLTPRAGVAVHINAYNFPAWGMAEKAAVALLAGMPVFTKPAGPTALVAHRFVELVVESGALPDGALQFLCGDPHDLVDHLQSQDALAFTGSSGTAAKLRAIAPVVGNSVPINVEADSLNAAVLGPDVDAGDDVYNLFLADVARDMTQKAGQKCTAIRRVFVHADRIDDVCEALAERLGDIVVGNPAESGVRMGPLTSAAQRDIVRAGIDRLVSETEAVYGGTGEVEPRGVEAGKGFFVGPVLRRAASADAAPSVNAHEVFGPVATVVPYTTAAEAVDLVRRGAGGLVSSVYSDDRGYLGEVVPAIAAFHGRVFVGSKKVAGQSPGPGTVLPHLTHGGPGRAGGGEELGGARGMRFYLQRTALEGDKTILAALTADAATLPA